MGALLYILSILISCILLPAGYVYGFVKQIYKRQFFKSFRILDDKFKKQAISIDRYGNIVCGELFNALLIRKSSHVFGSDRETISSVLGKNKQAGTLSMAGRALCFILDKIDPNHTLKNIGY
jgi:8-oxo-dGTP diphosphatase